MSASVGDLVAPLQPWANALVQRASALGLQPRFTSTRRSHAEQKRLWSRAQAGGSNFPVAPPGYSAHEYGEAFDLVASPYTLQTFRKLGSLWKSWRGGWGGAFHDPIHFE